MRKFVCEYDAALPVTLLLSSSDPVAIATPTLRGSVTKRLGTVALRVES